jgi:hypothetical protein
MSTKLTGLVATYYIHLARSFVVVVGCLAIWWGITEFPIFWQVSSVERIASRIVSPGDTFNNDILARNFRS